MKKGITILLVLAVLVCIYSGYTGKSDEMMIEDRMDSFLKAYNSGDMKGVFACMDAKTRNTYQAALAIGNELIGLTGFSVDIADLFSLGIGFAGDGDVLKLEDMKISIKSDSEATVNAVLKYQDPECSYSEKVSFTLVKEDGDWYIHG